MDQSLTRGSYVQVGDATYLVVQNDALEALPTFVGLPATATPLPHRPPLVIRDDANDLWIHTFAPATLLRDDITTIAASAPDSVMDPVTDALAGVLNLDSLRERIG